MDLSFRFDWWFARLPRSPRDAGKLVRVFVRPTSGTRARLASARLTPAGGVDGDRWSSDPDRSPGNQVSLINVHVIDSLSAHDPERSGLCGDNLHVDLDLSEENLPVGTALTIGEVVLEISAHPHRPCKHFHQRFGADGAKKVARANKVGRRGRGVMSRVLQGGEIREGDTIYVRRPASACLS
jgi:MOSC domain-containing protein YiiM